jgi:hypothetical protein
MTALIVKPEALAAWHALCGTLADLNDQGRATYCATDPAPFTSEDYHERREAAEACAACPAIAACRRFADENAEPAHVWGGVDRTPRTYSRKAVA